MSFEETARASLPFTFGRWRTYFFFHQLRHVVVQHDGIESPSFVCSGDFLSHGSQETLRIEESCHPEHVWSTFKQPFGELRMAVQKVGEPKSNSS